jgi:hypothetical protein
MERFVGYSIDTKTKNRIDEIVSYYMERFFKKNASNNAL